jgi:alpha-D-ribose 1-methylphosphonate 5-triphosphate diphosphatase
MILENARVVLPDGTLERGFVRLEDGFIAAVEEGNAPSSLEPRLNLQGHTLIPGIVDIHGDMLERELEPRPGTYFPVELALHELDKRLAANGVTTAYAAVALGDGPGLRSEERARALIRTIRAARASLLTDMRVHARFEIGLEQSVSLVHECLERDELDLVSLMDHTPGQGQFRDLEKYVEYMTRWLGNREAAEMSAREGVARPASWGIGREVAQSALARGVQVASHDDDSPEKVALMREFGATISEFPVTLEAARAAREAGLFVAMGAPNALRGASHGGNLSARDALAAGALDILAADYHPASLAAAAFALEASGSCAPHESVALVTLNPARAAGLTDRGRIAVGCRADLAVYSRDATPRLRLTLRDGRAIYDDGTLRAG